MTHPEIAPLSCRFVAFEDILNDYGDTNSYKNIRNKARP